MNPQLTDEQIIAIAKRNGGGISVDLRWRNDTFRRRLNRMTNRGIFRHKRQSGIDNFTLNN